MLCASFLVHKSGLQPTTQKGVQRVVDPKADGDLPVLSTVDVIGAVIKEFSRCPIVKQGRLHKRLFIVRVTVYFR